MQEKSVALTEICEPVKPGSSFFTSTSFVSLILGFITMTQKRSFVKSRLVCEKLKGKMVYPSTLETRENW